MECLGREKEMGGCVVATDRPTDRPTLWYLDDMCCYFGLSIFKMPKGNAVINEVLLSVESEGGCISSFSTNCCYIRL